MTCPVVVVGNQSRYKSRPLNTTMGIYAGAYDLPLSCLFRNFLRSYAVSAKCKR